MAISNLFSEESKMKYASQIERLKSRALEMKAKNVQATLIGMKNRTNYEAILKSFKKQKLIAAGKEDVLIDFTGIARISATCECEFFEMENGHSSWMEDFQSLTKTMHFID